MKTLLITLLLLTTITLKAQTTFELLDPFVSFGFDPKMATKGAGYDWGDTPSLDFEVRIGLRPFKDKGYRISHYYKQHKHIGFQKWGYLAVDRNILSYRGFEVYAGVEISGITRESFTYHFSKPDDYIQFQTNPIIFGANLEIQYTPKNWRFGIFAKGSFYQAETQLVNDGKKYRKDVTIGIVFNFFKHEIHKTNSKY